MCRLTEKALEPRSEVRTRAIHNSVAPTSVHQPISAGYAMPLTPHAEGYPNGVHQPISAGYAMPPTSQAEGYAMPSIAQLFRTSLMNDVGKNIDKRLASPMGSPSQRSLVGGPSHRVLVEREQEIRDAFVTMDVTNAGMLDYSEVKAAIRALGFPVKKKEVLAAMEKHGAMAHDRIDFDTFHTIMSEKYVELDPMQMMLRAFQLFDKQGQGRISVRDLQVVAAKLGERLSDNELQAMIDHFDKNSDGEIDELEFIQIMQMTGLY